MKKNNKKGFTIVELVIVIAVIAILAAVLIPTFSSVIKKAKVNNDIQLVRNLNTALATDTKEHKTMQSALDAAFEFGYDVAKINNTSVEENEILWDSVNDCFVYLKDGTPEYIPNSKKTNETVQPYQFWQIANAIPETQTYSIYAGTGWSAATVENLTVGFDAGTTTGITAINYKGSAQDVVIRTNGGTLTIENDDATVYYYGSIDELNGNAIAMESLHIRGYIATLNLKKGHIVMEEGGKIGDLVIPADAVSGSVKITNPLKDTIDNFIALDDTKQIEYNGNVETVGNLKIEIEEDINYIVPDRDVLGYGTPSNPYEVGTEAKLAEMFNKGTPLAIKLTESFTFTSRFVISSEVTLDLNGKTISTSENKAPFWISSTGSLTIDDTSISKTGEISGISTTAASANGDYNSLIFIDNGKLTVNGGNIYFTSETVNIRTAIVYNSYGIVTINDGLLKVTAQGAKSSSLCGIVAEKSTAEVIMNGGKIWVYNNGNGSTSSYMAGIYTQSGAKIVTMTGGEILVEDLEGTSGFADKYGINARSPRITGGKITVIAKNKTGYGVSSYPASGYPIIIKNCEITVKGNGNAYLFELSNEVNAHSDTVIEGITGTVTAGEGKSSGVIETYTSDQQYCNIVKGGVYNVQPDDWCLAEGYVTVDNGDGTWTVQEK